MSRSCQLINEGGRQNDNIAGRPLQQLLFHQTYRTKGARKLRVSCLFNRRLERVDQTLRGSAAEEMNKASQSINPI
jgi:hypothetical protein